MKEPRTSPPPGTPEAPEEQPKWRRDFPIDRPQDDYVARRDFTRFMVLISGSFVVGQFWIALQNFFRRRRGEPPIRSIASKRDLAVGEAMAFHYPSEHDPCVLVRLGEDDFVAYGSQCTHLMCPVIPRVDQRRFHCPCHEGWFDMESGAALSGPPRRPLPRVALEVRGETIYATNVEVRSR